MATSLKPPIAGLNRAASFQSQPDFTTQDCADVVGFDTLEGRARMSKRPCLARHFPALLGNGAPIRLAASIRTFNSLGTTTFSDTFDGSAMSGSWTAGSFNVYGQAVSGGLPDVGGGSAKLPAGSTSLVRSAILTGVTDILNTGYREVAVIPPSGSPNPNETYHLYLDLNSAALSESVGVVARISGAQSVSGILYVTITVNGIDVLLGDLVSVANVQFLRLSIDSANRIRVSWDDSGTGIEFVANGYTPVSSANLRAGFALHRDNNSLCEANSFALSYITSSGGVPPESACFSARGHFYRESISGTLTQITAGPATAVPTGISLASDRRLYAVNRLDKLYIADYGVKHQRLAKHTNATVANVSGTQAILDDSDVTSWTAKLIDPLTDYLEVIATTEGTPSAAPAVSIGIYSIASVHVTNGVTFNRSNAWTASAVAYRILRAPKVYDAGLNSLTLMGTGTLGTSQPPIGFQHVELQGDRLHWSKNELYPQLIVSSAISDPLDYDYGDTGNLGDAAAIDWSTSEFAGMIGEPVQRTVRATDDVLMIGCVTSWYFLLGNLRLAGAQLRIITDEVGLVSPDAVCKTPDGRTIVMTAWGLYDLTPQPGGAKELSRDVLPSELHSLSSERYETILTYDGRRRRINIDASGLDAATPSIHYFHDLRTGAFWPRTQVSDHDFMSATTYEAGQTSQAAVLFGCRDGYVRRFDDAAINDDSVPFRPYYWIFPFRGGRNDEEFGIIHDLSATIDERSGPVTIEVYSGETPQAAKGSTAVCSVVLAAGANYVHPVEFSGVVFGFKVIGTPCEAMIVEDIPVNREFLGVYRKV